MSSTASNPAGNHLGQRVGAYTLERLIGRGGMSFVYLGRHSVTARVAAVKIVHRDLPESIDADRRLEQEARAIARIDHPHVVKVYDLGWTDDGLPFLAMEYLKGQPLSQFSGHGQPLALGRVVGLALQITEGLHRAHELGIVHRDLKPENIILTEENGQSDFVKILDFGIAKLVGKQPHSIVNTRRGVVLGTPEYLPPEIAMDMPVSPATDIYALGVILFEALTGRLPFQGRGIGELAEKHCFTPPPSPRIFNPSLPAEIENILRRCLAKDPKHRYLTAASLGDALRPFAQADEDQMTMVTLTPLPSGTTADGRGEGDGNSPDHLEQEIRGEVSRRWTDRTLPQALQRTLSRLDHLHARSLEIGTDLAVLDDRLSMSAGVATEFDQSLAHLVQEEDVYDGECRGLQSQALKLSTELGRYDRRSIELLEAIRVGCDPRTSLLQSLLQPTRLEHAGERIRERTTIERLEVDRRRVLSDLERATHLRTETTVRRARLQADLAQVVVERGADRMCALARRDGMTAELEQLRRSQINVIYQLALDLAVAVGG